MRRDPKDPIEDIDDGTQRFVGRPEDRPHPNTSIVRTPEQRIRELEAGNTALREELDVERDAKEALLEDRDEAIEFWNRPAKRLEADLAEARRLMHPFRWLGGGYSPEWTAHRKAISIFLGLEEPNLHAWMTSVLNKSAEQIVLWVIREAPHLNGSSSLRAELLHLIQYDRVALLRVAADRCQHIESGEWLRRFAAEQDPDVETD